MLTTFQALLQPVPARAEFAARRRVLRRGETVDLEELAAWLVDHGYQHTEAVELPGEFSRRGGILDVYSPDAEAPYRLEFFGDEIESIRQFSPQTQRSLGELEQAEWAAVGSRRPMRRRTASTTVRGFRVREGISAITCPQTPGSCWWRRTTCRNRAGTTSTASPTRPGCFPSPDVFQQLLRFPSVKVSALPSPSVEATFQLHVESVERFSGDVGRVRDELDAVAARDRVLIACHNDGECKRLDEVLAAGQLAQSDRLRLVVGRVRAGFRLVDPVGVVVLGGQELFHRDERPDAGLPAAPRRRLESRAIDSFLDLAEGDLVVHVSHGIARYRGMQVLEKNGRRPGRRTARQRKNT